MSEPDKDIQSYLARIRKTIADSKSIVSQAELRIAETDRMLERHGLTREQVMAMRFSEAQMEAVNAELKRRGLDPLERWEDGEVETSRAEITSSGKDYSDGSVDSSGVTDAELENRQRKFGMMMKPFHI